MDKLVVEYCKEIRRLIAELEIRHGGFDSYGKEKGRKTKESKDRGSCNGSSGTSKSKGTRKTS